MKRTALALTLILALLFSTVAGAKLVNGAEANPEQLQTQIMSFEEAIESANIDNFSGSMISYSLTGEPKGDLFVDGSGVSGFLMWLAPNGTFYEAEYPNGTALGEIGHTFEESDWNPPDGYYIWHLGYGGGEEYWVLANNGTIFLYNPPRGGGPLPTQPPIPQEIIYRIIVAVSVAVIGSGLLVYFKKRKR
jgi:hypothetical protein